ncbi:sensor domain-containing diguanylate cyclase [Clostridium sp. YIM B02551]|uniref:sensor domain-containing diguanylate cyclase n=1 Tax=Clostridium sp. YIM B02551 TaxID=2910679 RepID=UPI001EEB0604|nr:sensor domain-containing diguanylate cyclase [Clostridium sp. YIM B02551]
MVEFFLYGCATGASLIILYYMVVNSKRNKKLKRIINQQKRILKLVQMSKDIIYCYQIKPEGKFTYLSPSIEKILGKNLVKSCYSDSSIPLQLIHPDDIETIHKKISGEINFDKPIVQRWRNDKGKYIWFEEYATPIYRKGQLVAIQGIIRNIDDKIKFQESLEYKICHDSFTGLYNKEFFLRACEKYNRDINTRAAIIVCDLDNLKITNDTHGHMEGDNLIKETANILNKFSSKNIIVSRIGGDEFALLIVRKSQNFIKEIIEKINNELNYHHEQEVNMNMSIGYAYTESSLGDMDALFRKADKNMYVIKNNKKAI